jgi:hypothetical protein
LRFFGTTPEMMNSGKAVFIFILKLPGNVPVKDEGV